MNKICFLITIVDSKVGEEMISFLNENNVPLTLGRYGKGTATSEMIEYFGVGETEKYVLFSTLKISDVKNISEKIKTKFKRSVFSILVPISSVGGNKTMEYISGELGNNEKENDIKYKYDSELIVIVAKRGYVDMVMNIARKAGASGGTVIHARGTGTQDSEKFFGVTVGAEKEMIFVLSEKEKKNEIMKAVMNEAGLESEAQAVVFSLPANKLLD